MAINFDYNKTMQQAARLEEITQDLLAVSNKRMAASIDNIGAAWSGAASKEFLNYFKRMQEDVRTKANVLQKTAQTLRTVAKTMKTAEENAKSIVSNGLARG